MAIFPPQERIWWKQPLHWQELTWLAVCLVWALTMFFTMIVWHSIGDQNLSNEAYRISPEKFAERTEAMVEKFQVREEGDSGRPVVHPPAESDVYMLGRTYEWWPVLELEKGKSYRLHLSSMDLQHGFSLQPTNINVQVHPGYELVMTVTPNETGEFGVICNEFCGIGHHAMVGRIHVVE
jgi:cytochrome c oxidase subunit 2